MSIVFGSYTFPLTFTAVSDAADSDVPRAQIPRRHGSVALAGYLTERKIRVTGSLIGADGNHPITNCTVFRTALDALKGACNGGAGSLYVDPAGDRYYANAQKLTLMVTSPAEYLAMADIDVDFVCPDPFAYSTTLSSDTWNSGLTSGATHVVTNGAGDAFAVPVITITLAATAALALTISNNTTGEACTLNGTPTGTVIVIDTGAEDVYYSGGPPGGAFGLFDGIFPTLALGANTLQITLGAGNAATISSIVTTWRSRWF